ncbi:hypothetical protein [Roseovarius aestuariivivens]|uniref:hypothetical protein n=1 Tax=Roseovarius aestuariivivens TaxID=1888910 RepID=UPI0010813C46|nr:hypothetical protein [Roseovarius aestuariivivens]
MSLASSYAQAIAARRAFQLPGYPSLADEGYDGDYVSPIQMTSGSLTGPMLVSKDWLDAPSARRHRDVLMKQGYLPENPFNRVIDKVLKLLGLSRSDLYITPVFHLLTPQRSSTIPPAHARASWEAVGQHERLGRRPIALGHDSARVLKHFGVPHVQAPHPSARTGTFDEKAARIAEAVRAA